METKVLTPLPDSKTDTQVLEDLELQLLLQAIRARYGFDFLDYAKASMKRRVHQAMLNEPDVKTISSYQDRILHDHEVMARFLDSVSVTVTGMFRDAGFYKVLREKVVPWLKEQPLIRIWHAGCSSGEEVYSMAILLHEEGLLERSRSYATDINQRVLEVGKEGIFPIKFMREHTVNYQNSGGKASLSDYYTAHYDSVKLREFLGRNIVWAQHNLVTDGSFNEFHLIFCRNVMIYFNRTLQDRVHRLIFHSLSRGGYLGLGRAESLLETPHEDHYVAIDRTEKIYRKLS